MTALLVVMLDDPKCGAGPGNVVEVTTDPMPAILARYTDRDGARSDRLRVWLAFDGAKVGQKVSSGGAP